MKINSSGNLTKKVICENFGDLDFEVKFLNSIFILTEYFLFEYNYSLDLKWKFPIGSYLQISAILGFDFVVTSQHEVYTIYYTSGDINFVDRRFRVCRIGNVNYC